MRKKNKILKSIKNQNEKKQFGRVYTPDWIVKKILDEVDYQGVDILGKKILDPSCGDGQFLKEIVKRILKQSSPKKTEIKKNLENIYGWDIDESAIEKCKYDLDLFVKEYDTELKINWHIDKINWNIEKQDALKKIENEESNEFDFIVGNPPYIRVHHLPLKDRSYIKQHYNFCKKGVTDIYLAFFELCYKHLKNDGVCGLITPNTYFSTENARFLRNSFVEKKNLLKIINFRDELLFDNAQTYSAITIFNKNQNDFFQYVEQVPADNANPPTREFTFEEIPKTSNWQLSVNKIEIILNGKPLKEICHIHVGLATLMDKAYIFQKNELTGKYYNKNVDRADFEPQILKKIIKTSRYSENDKIKEYILFPYTKKDNKYQILEEDVFKMNYPKAFQYLTSIKDKLATRDKGHPKVSIWYAFGRSQALDNSFGDKIVFSYMNNQPKFSFVEDKENEITFYSGYCIKLKDETRFSYEKLLQQLNSERMQEFIGVSSRYFQNGWKAYNKKIIENFIIDMDFLTL